MTGIFASPLLAYDDGCGPSPLVPCPSPRYPMPSRARSSALTEPHHALAPAKSCRPVWRDPRCPHPRDPDGESRGMSARPQVPVRSPSLDFQTLDCLGSVPLMRYVTVLTIWCRWPDTPWWHAKAQEFVHGPDVVCYTCCHGGGMLHPLLE